MQKKIIFIFFAFLKSFSVVERHVHVVQFLYACFCSTTFDLIKSKAKESYPGYTV